MAAKLSNSPNLLPTLFYNTSTKETNYPEFKERLINIAYGELSFISAAITSGSPKTWNDIPNPPVNASQAEFHIWKRSSDQQSEEKIEWKRNNRKLTGLILSNIHSDISKLLFPVIASNPLQP